MGSVAPYETAKGRRYRVRYRTPERKQTDKRGFRTKRDAELFLASVEVSKARGEFVRPEAARETIGQLGPAWLANQSHLKPSSYRPLEIAWRLHVEPVWGRTRVSDVGHSAVQSWVTRMTAEKGATTVIRNYGVLAGILDVAVKDRRILTNPARDINLPRKKRKEHTYLSHDQVSALALASGERSTLVLVLAYCGLRWGEATGLRVKDLDLLRRRINVTVNAVNVGGVIEVGTPKSHKRRSVPFPASLAAPLARLCVGKTPDDLVFASRHGTHEPRWHNEHGWFPTAVRKSGVPPLTPHDLRHTAASLAISAGANVKAVQRMLGHASAAMTLDVYADLFDDDLDPVADRLDEGLSRTVVGKMWAEAAHIEGKAR
ncbi:tyrosine-type recombinase/integrase [Curtobacterium sp. GD1]|uniref:tyrosine-type recombinase/integrase n=1 Tax=Curtobacterium sp. GD1 TaxID=2810612 RepID=UPI001E3D042C|nr:tyrosine-type recombinase/integrase [Curtobacterium sp. GD1]MCC8909456.1 site-specific integrase [Curtobacterium sp. GD1]